MMILLAIIITFIFSYSLLKIRRKKRIEEIVDLMKALDSGNYRIPMKQDDYSILEDEIYKLFLKLVEERELTKEMSQKQARNLEDIAHQIKTPLTSMSFSLELAKEEDNLHIKNLIKQMDRLNRLTDILLKLASLENNIARLKEDEILISEVLDYVLDILEEEILENEVKIVKQVGSEKITGDFYWISEAMINILRNAILVSKEKPIRITTCENPIYTEITIEDEGGGILESDMKKIFERFYKSPDSSGFGIGLSMAKLLVENSNGEINVKNGEKGAVFTIKFYNVT